MKYHVYRYGNGCKWLDDFQEAVDYFNGLPTDGRYTTIGITEGSYAVDVIIKGQYAEGQEFLISQDVKKSRLFEENPEKVISELSRLYEAVGVEEEISCQILSDLRHLANELDEFEEM